MLKIIVCIPTGCTICFINHDGVQEGACAGAKAWMENMTMRTRLEEVRAEDGSRLATKAIMRKDRVGGQLRSFTYRLGTHTAFELMEDVEIVGRCEEVIAQILFQLELEGKRQARTKTIVERAANRGIPEKTVLNTLSACNNGDFFRRKSRGIYQLTENQLQAMLKHAG